MRDNDSLEQMGFLTLGMFGRRLKCKDLIAPPLKPTAGVVVTWKSEGADAKLAPPLQALP